MNIVALLVMLLMSWLLPAEATPEKIKIDLFEAHQSVSQITVFGPAKIDSPVQRTLPPGKFSIIVHGDNLDLVSAANPKSAPIVASPHITLSGASGKGVSLSLDGTAKRSYQGFIEFVLQPRQVLKARNTVPVRSYVESVVSSETPAKWPMEALKAQAVLTQTRLARHLPSMVVGDSTQRELYMGADAVRPEVRDAVNSVWGHSLVHDNRPIAVFYHSTCGGSTSGGEAIFANKSAVPPYLVPIYCIYCSKSPFAKTTTRRITKEAMTKAFAGDPPEVVEVDGSGRPLKVKLADGKVLTGYQFWVQLGNAMGWDKAPGTRFKLATLPNGDLEVSSTGAGHGVGMCQWGAAEMAHQGKTYKEILQFYFPGTSVIEPKHVAQR